MEAEEQLARSPKLLKTPSGYVQQSPWLSIANKQMELLGRYMSELGLTPAARTRLPVPERPGDDQALKIQFVTMTKGEDGDWEERPLDLGNRDLKAV